MFGVIEREGRRLINGHGAGVRGGIGIVAGVQRSRVEAKRSFNIFGAH